MLAVRHDPDCPLHQQQQQQQQEPDGQDSSARLHLLHDRQRTSHDIQRQQQWQRRPGRREAQQCSICTTRGSARPESGDCSTLSRPLTIRFCPGSNSRPMLPPRLSKDDGHSWFRGYYLCCDPRSPRGFKGYKVTFWYTVSPQTRFQRAEHTQTRFQRAEHTDQIRMHVQVQMQMHLVCLSVQVSYIL